jgi:hypothetical protein
MIVDKEKKRKQIHRLITKYDPENQSEVVRAVVHALAGRATDEEVKDASIVELLRKNERIVSEFAKYVEHYSPCIISGEARE